MIHALDPSFDDTTFPHLFPGEELQWVRPNRALPLLIGLHGRAGVGKDTCAQLLQAHGFRSIAFADAVREEICAAFGVSVGLLTAHETKHLPLAGLAVSQCTDPAFIVQMALLGEDIHAARSPRWVMQRWGTEYRRAQRPDYWISIVHRWVTRQRGIGVVRLIVTDVRFANEAALITALGGHIVRVFRPDLDLCQPQDTSGHVSAQALDAPYAEVIHNDGTLQQLELELVRVLCALPSLEAAR